MGAFTICSAAADNKTKIFHLFLGRKLDLLKADHSDLSLCECAHFKDANLLVGCVAINIKDMARKFRGVKGVKCKSCRNLLAEIVLNFH